MKRLLIDINSIIPYYTIGNVYGIGRSTLELLKALKEIKDIPFEITLFSQNTHGVTAKKDFPFHYLHFYMPYRPFFKYIANWIHLKKWFYNYDLLHMPNNTDPIENESKVIYTIHDLIVWHHPDMWVIKNREHFFRKLKSSLQNCKAIVTCSEASKKDILTFSGISEKKVAVIPWGVNRDIFHPTYNANYLQKMGITGLFYFSASCNHPRKNLPLLLKAYKKYVMEKGKGQLVLLNPLNKDLENYQDLILSNRIIICKNISDQELVYLYSSAHCSIIISEYEGFGLPILESLACHTQVLSTRNSSLVEVGGEIIDYLDVLTEETLSERLLAYDTQRKDELANTTQIEKHLSIFSWERCAEKYIRFYNQQLNL